MKPTLFTLAACVMTAVLCAPSGHGETQPNVETPKSPPAYTSEEVELTNAKAGVKLAGTLLLPRTKGPHPAVVLVSGSGPYVRDPGMPEKGYFGPLASRLLREGVAVLHYDKRGCGKSEGDKDLLQSTMLDFAEDALTAVDYLRGREEIDPKRVGLYGHSEGSSVVPLAASRSKDVAFIVLTGASVLTADRIILTQVEAMAPLMGESPERLKENLEALQLSFDTLRAEKNDDQAKIQLSNLLKERQPNRSEKEVREQFGSMISPYFRFHLSHNQPATMAQVRCPILVVNGDKDLLVLDKFNTAPMREALKGHPDATMKVLPGLDHMLLPVIPGTPEGQVRTEKDMSPAALDLISGWLRRHIAPK